MLFARPKTETDNACRDAGEMKKNSGCVSALDN